MCKEAQRVYNESSKSQHFDAKILLHSNCLHLIFPLKCAHIQFGSNPLPSKFRRSPRISVNKEAMKKSHFITESKPFEWLNVHKLCRFLLHVHSWSASKKKGAGVLIRHRSRILWFVTLSTCFTTLTSTHFSSLFFSRRCFRFSSVGNFHFARMHSWSKG